MIYVNAAVNNVQSACNPLYYKVDAGMLENHEVAIIVTSWFFNLCRSSYGMITVNNRNRYENYTNLHAGNYQSILLYSFNDFSSPNLIRQSVLSMRSKSGKVPNALETLWYNMYMVRNWSSFYSEVSLDGDNQLTIHLPIMNPAEAIFRDTCILFNLNKSTQALLFALHSVDCDNVKSCNINMYVDDKVGLLGDKLA